MIQAEKPSCLCISYKGQELSIFEFLMSSFLCVRMVNIEYWFCYHLDAYVHNNTSLLVQSFGVQTASLLDHKKLCSEIICLFLFYAQECKCTYINWMVLDNKLLIVKSIRIIPVMYIVRILETTMLLLSGLPLLTRKHC